MKANRLFSFIVILIVYVFAIILGFVLFNNLHFELWINLLISDIVATVFVFIFSVVLKNASVYDPYWSVQPIVIVIGFSFVNKLNLASILAIVAVCLWGIRLTINWVYTFKNLYHQDWRYTMLKEKTGKYYIFINFIGIHLVPTLVVYSCILPVVYLMHFVSKVNALTIFFFILEINSLR